MDFTKTYRSLQLEREGRSLLVEGPVEPAVLRSLTMHPQLDAFRRPEDQLEALAEIAELPEGRILLARDEAVLVGYVTFHYPDELERWSEAGMADLIELGAIEVANDYRGCGLAGALLELAFAGGELEETIVFTTEYYWHWDLRQTGLSVWDYRAMMEKLMKRVGMVAYATDDPEICSHPANCLMVRIGSRVPAESAERFDRIRFRRRFMY